MNQFICIGLDVHVESITAAILEGDRSDAVMLARLYRTGHLTPIHIPTVDQEALRRLIRLRLTYQEQCKSTKRRVYGMLLNGGLE